MAAGADWRISEAGREAVAGQLREHHAAGRLTMDEFRARLDAAYSAMTAGELARVTADLPAVGAAGWAGTRSPGGSPARAGRRRWRGLIPLLVLAGLVAGGVLIVNSLPHGGLVLLALLLLVVPVVLLTGLVATLVWVGRRAWRSGAWLEMVPVAVGAPWLGRVMWVARAALVGRAFWRLGGRAARARRAGRAGREQARRPLRSRGAYAQYQDYPDGPWHQARVGDLNGTTR